MTRMWLLLVALCLVSCEDSDALIGETDVPVGEVIDGTITLLTSNPSLPTTSDSEVTLTAIVKDDSNNLLEGVAVAFSATSGSLRVTQSTTDANGQALAVLSPGTDLSNRTITVSALTGNLSASVDVVAAGTAITISGSTSLVSGSPTTLTLTLVDAEGNGIANQPATVTLGSTANTIVADNGFTTDSKGQVAMTLTASESDTLTASALGAATSFLFTVSNDAFSIAVESDEIPIDICSPATVTWLLSGEPIEGQSVEFSTTRGTLYGESTCSDEAQSATTDANGEATIYVKSPNPGVFEITASGDTVSTTKTGEFIATDPAVITFQAERTTIGPNESVTLTAIVRDANNNLVKNAIVTFNITHDVSGGSISPGSDTTDSLGRAQTVYTSTDATSSTEGVEISATVEGLSATVKLTVAESSLFVSFGMANLVAEETAASYAHPGTVFVTSSGGNAVAGAEVTLSAIPVSYFKGWREWDGKVHAPTSALGLPNPPTGPCANEDFLTGDPRYDGNGVLDPGEDFNSSKELEPRNVVSVEQLVTTNEFGYAEFNLRYAKDYASWVVVEVVATARVGGSEGSDRTTFALVELASDVSSETKAPPGPVSPFGYALSCDIAG